MGTHSTRAHFSVKPTNRYFYSRRTTLTCVNVASLKNTNPVFNMSMEKIVLARPQERFLNFNYRANTTMITTAAIVMRIGRISAIQPIARLFSFSCLMEKLNARI